jgi:outer membrane protein TolC
MIESEIKQKMIALNTLMNQDEETSFNIDTTYSVKSYEIDLHDTAYISTVRSDYKTISQNINMLRTKQIYEQSKQNPDYGLRYDHMFAFGKQPQQFSLMFMATIPIVPWSSKAYKANIAGLSLEMEALKQQQQSVLNNTDGEVRLLKEQIKSKKEQLSLYEKSIIPSIKKNYESMLIAYEQNTEELAMTIDGAQNLKTIQISYLDQLMELLMLQVKYERELEIMN